MRVYLVVLVLLCVIACSEQDESNQQKQPEKEEAQALEIESNHEIDAIENYKTIEWIDLMPAHHLEALLNPPEYLADIEDGTREDRIDSTIQHSSNSDIEGDIKGLSKYQQALISTDVIGEMDGQKIRLPGYVVPLELDENRDVLSFFLVPFFGACIHAPPPPPNQIIYVESAEGFLLESLYDPVWISGTLSTQMIENDLATAAYTMKLSYFENYGE